MPTSWLAVTLKFLEQIALQSELLAGCRGWNLQAWAGAARSDQKGMQKSLVKAYLNLKQTGWAITKTQISDLRQWTCEECGHMEQSWQALSVHMAGLMVSRLNRGDTRQDRSVQHAYKSLQRELAY